MEKDHTKEIKRSVRFLCQKAGGNGAASIILT